MKIEADFCGQTEKDFAIRSPRKRKQKKIIDAQDKKIKRLHVTKSSLWHYISKMPTVPGFRQGAINIIRSKVLQMSEEKLFTLCMDEMSENSFVLRHFSR